MALAFKRQQEKVTKEVEEESARIEKSLGKKINIVVDYEPTKAFEGEQDGFHGVRTTKVIALMLLSLYVTNGHLDAVIREVCKDALGKEAFLETFDTIKISVHPGKAEDEKVSKSGKTLVLQYFTKADNYNGAGEGSMCAPGFTVPKITAML